ncbi:MULTISPECIES: hypothetical protein [Mycolicibacterium]|uniref:hypothetical protein n=1 Tax=Mycolicibacterium TaxID=1866885 RepID=UPI0007EB2106|nr:hypothetical protein [Mycolicibacterium fortuitum]OBG24069.1 hypothetical protein A5768_22100 [Mycolicibacterium fortuitum]
MTENMIDIEASWIELDLPRVQHAAPSIDAWTTDDEIAEQANELAAVYGNEFEVGTELRLFRTRLRASAMAVAAQR